MKALILFVLLSLGCFSQTVVRGKVVYDTTYQAKDGSLFTCITPLVDGTVHGVEVVYLDKGLYTETPFKNGEQEGLEKWYSRDGKVKLTVWFVSGTYHGVCTHYDGNGKVTKETWYFYGMMMTKEEFDKENNEPYISAF